MTKYYRFTNKKGLLKIPHGAIVELILWSHHRHVLIKYEDEIIKTMGYHLRKIDNNNVGGQL